MSKHNLLAQLVSSTLTSIADDTTYTMYSQQDNRLIIEGVVMKKFSKKPVILHVDLNYGHVYMIDPSNERPYVNKKQLCKVSFKLDIQTSVMMHN
jgi:hypothetical protein